MEIKNLDVFIGRMKKLGIEIQLLGNFPWVYVDTINGKKVKEKFQSEHGWVIGFYPIRKGDSFRFTDLKALFKLIRKYK